MPFRDDPEAEPLPDDEEQLTDFHPNDRKNNYSTSSGTSMSKKACYLCAYTFFVAMLAFVAFDQGFVVLAGSEETAPAVTEVVTTAAGSSRPAISEEVYGKTVAKEIEMLESWRVAMAEAKQLIDAAGSDRSGLACLNADTAATERVVKDALAGKYTTTKTTANKASLEAAKVPLPALNLGMPKCGTTSQQDFFHCAGYTVTHSFLKDLTHQGLCFRDAAANNLPVLEECTQGTDALTEMDAHSAFGLPYKMGAYTSNERRDDCFFPQLSMLEEFHNDNEGATFILPFRPAKDWVESVMNWSGNFGIKEVMECNLPNLPKGIPDIDVPKEELVASFEEYICSHVIHVRNFVRDHPTHALIEYDLYDKPFTGKVLGQLFPDVKTQTDSSDCWQHVAHKNDIHQGDKTVSF